MSFLDRAKSHPDWESSRLKPISYEHTIKLFDQLLAVIVDLGKRDKTIESHVIELSKQVKAIESKGVSYRGVYQRASEYTYGDMTTWDGCMWHCVVEKTRAHPGKSADWQLAVKRGDNASTRER